MMLDARVYRIKKTLSGVKNIISVVSGKGGVGKTTISTVMSLLLSSEENRVGLLDLDFHGPSCHVVLGIDKMEYEEERGINPYKINDLLFASIYPFVGDKYIPLRGKALSNAMIEFMSILNWGDLDYLIIDMPPGMGDPLLDLMRLASNLKFLVVTTNSMLSIQTVKRLVMYILESGFDLIGIIANMVKEDDSLVRKLADDLSVRFLGSVPFDPEYEYAIGNPGDILNTKLAQALREILVNTL